MSASPVICFGQQPCGFFPRRFLAAKFHTARRLRSEIGGQIVFFYHDSDHDPRETTTILRHRQTGEPARLNFACDNKIQRKFSPLFLKRIAAGWREKTLLQLPNYLDRARVDLFAKASGATVADFCLDMCRLMGFLDGVRVARSGDPGFRRGAIDIDEFFVDVPFQGEIVRARRQAGSLRLHEGGDSYVDVPPVPFTKEQISPARDTRFRWMQSVLRCTHYIAGRGEQAYLHPGQFPEVTFVPRDEIERSDEAYTELSG